MPNRCFDVKGSGEPAICAAMSVSPLDRPIARRAFLGASALVATGLSARALAEQRGLAAAAAGVDPALVYRALLALARHHEVFWSRDEVAIADFGLPSASPRFHLVDLLAGNTTTLLVAHGKGSDPEHSGFLQTFSNIIGSNATSEGAYLTGERYDGIHGPSRRLIGLDETNSNAEPRAIVIHGAWYVGPEIVATQGRLGRSDGCFVFSERDIGQVLTRLGRGRLLYAGKG
jgi:hypothetical protein